MRPNPAGDQLGRALVRTSEKRTLFCARTMALRRISTFSRATKAASAADTLGFTPTSDLLNQLPQQERPASAVVRKRKKKKRVTALWAPRAGGEGALLAAKQREKIEAVEARIDLTEDSGRLLVVLVGLPARQLRQNFVRIPCLAGARAATRRSRARPRAQGCPPGPRGEPRRRVMGADG